jgi:hypothetical protein
MPAEDLQRRLFWWEEIRRKQKRVRERGPSRSRAAEMFL